MKWFSVFSMVFVALAILNIFAGDWDTANWNCLFAYLNLILARLWK